MDPVTMMLLQGALSGTANGGQSGGAGVTQAGTGGIPNPSETIGSSGKAALGIGLGVGQLISGKIKERKAEKLFPSLEDPAEQAFINELHSKQKAFETGTAVKTATDELAKSVKTTQRGIVKLSGGNVGLAIKGLSATQKGAGSAINELYLRSLENSRFYTEMRGRVMSNMVQRRLDLQMNKFDQKMADARSLQKSGMSNTLAGIGFGINVAGGGEGGIGTTFNGGTGPTTSTTPASFQPLETTTPSPVVLDNTQIIKDPPISLGKGSSIFKSF